MNKKLVAMLSALALCVTVTACSKNDDNTKYKVIQIKLVLT